MVWGVFSLQDLVALSLRHPVVVPVENFVYGVCKLLMLIGVVSLLPSTGIFFSWVIPLVITVPAVNWLIFRRYLKDPSPVAPPGAFRVREVIRFASVDYLGTVLSQAYGNLLPLLILSTLGATANGSFYIAWTIASGLGLVALNFGASLLVEGVAAPHRLAELTRGILIRCLLITSLGAGVLVLAARPILDIYGSGYAVHAASLLGLLSVGTVPSCLVVVAVSLDRIVGRVGIATLTRLVLTVLVLGGSWLLVRKVGIDGVAFAWGGANLVVALTRFPTIVGAVRPRAFQAGEAISVPWPSAVPRPRTQAHSHLPGLHRRPMGRHRAAAHRARQPERRGHLPSQAELSVADEPTMPIALEPAGQTAQALRLLMSLGTEVHSAPVRATMPKSPVPPTECVARSGTVKCGDHRADRDRGETHYQEDLSHPANRGMPEDRWM